MTREIVIGILKSHLEHDTLDAATYHALGCAITELECPAKPEDHPHDEGGMTDITEAIIMEMCPVNLGLPQDCSVEKDCRECWSKALCGRRAWLEDAPKPLNRPSAARKSARQGYIPESPNDTTGSDLRADLRQCETEIMMLWDAVNSLKEKMK